MSTFSQILPAVTAGLPEKEGGPAGYSKDQTGVPGLFQDLIARAMSPVSNKNIPPEQLNEPPRKGVPTDPRAGVSSPAPTWQPMLGQPDGRAPVDDPGTSPHSEVESFHEPSGQRPVQPVSTKFAVNPAFRPGKEIIGVPGAETSKEWNSSGTPYANTPRKSQSVKSSLAAVIGQSPMALPAGSRAVQDAPEKRVDEVSGNSVNAGDRLHGQAESLFPNVSVDAIANEMGAAVIAPDSATVSSPNETRPVKVDPGSAIEAVKTPGVLVDKSIQSETPHAGACATKNANVAARVPGIPPLASACPVRNEAETDENVALPISHSAADANTVAGIKGQPSGPDPGIISEMSAQSRLGGKEWSPAVADAGRTDASADETVMPAGPEQRGQFPITSAVELPKEPAWSAADGRAPLNAAVTMPALSATLIPARSAPAVQSRQGIIAPLGEGTLQSSLAGQETSLTPADVGRFDVSDDKAVMAKGEEPVVHAPVAAPVELPEKSGSSVASSTAAVNTTVTNAAASAVQGPPAGQRPGPVVIQKVATQNGVFPQSASSASKPVGTEAAVVSKNQIFAASGSRSRGGPENLPQLQPAANGTPIAKQDVAMKQAEKTNKIAGQTEKVLPGNAISSTRANSPLLVSGQTGQLAATAAANNFHTDVSTAAAVPPSALAGGAAMNSLHDRILDRVQDMVTLNSMRLSDSGNNSMQVVIKPDAGTQLSLELRQHNGGVQIQAVLQQGDFNHLNQQWSDLQHRLDQRGIRLASLTQDAAPANSGGNQEFQSKQNSTNEPIPVLPSLPTSATTVAATGMEAQRQTYRGWETWA